MPTTRRWLDGDYNSTPALRLRQFPVRWKHYGRARLALKRNAFKRNIYLSFNWNGGRSAADSDEFRRRILIPFDLSARLFSARRPGEPRYLWNIDTGVRWLLTTRVFSQEGGWKKQGGETPRKRRAASEQRINGRLEASRRPRLQRTRRGWIIALLLNRHSPVIFRLFIHACDLHFSRIQTDSP